MECNFFFSGHFFQPFFPAVFPTISPAIFWPFFPMPQNWTNRTGRTGRTGRTEPDSLVDSENHLQLNRTVRFLFLVVFVGRFWGSRRPSFRRVWGVLGVLVILYYKLSNQTQHNETESCNSVFASYTNKSKLGGKLYGSLVISKYILY